MAALLSFEQQETEARETTSCVPVLRRRTRGKPAHTLGNLFPFLIAHEFLPLFVGFGPYLWPGKTPL